MLKDKKGCLIRDKEKRKQRWKEHFDQLLNVANETNDSDVYGRFDLTKSEENEPESSETEMELAIKRL